MIVYYNGAFLDKDDVHIHPDDRGWLFADGIYEVIRVYRGCPFQLAAHGDRLRRSASEIGIELPADLDLAVICGQLIERNETLEDATLYVQVTRGVAPRAQRITRDIPPTVYVCLDRYQPNPAQFTRGFGVLLLPDTRWARCDVKTINLLPNILAKRTAQEAGCDEAVFTYSGNVTEGTHTSVVAVRDGVVITSPTSDNILPSITRSILLELCRDAGIPVHADRLTVDGFLASYEAMLLGTTTEVTPIREIRMDPSVGGRNEPVRFETPGPVTKKLQAAYREMIHRECGG